MPEIRLDGIGKIYQSAGRQVAAVGRVDLSIADGEFVTLVGPSGCGKSTLLNMIAGFLPPSAGSIRVDGTEVAGTIPAQLGYIFQKDTVLPWYTVRRNIGLGLRFRGRRRSEIDGRVDDLLRLGKLEGFGDAYPHQLSGGMRRRVALLMSLACDPRILLLDEPFGALDTHTKTVLHQELIRIWRSLGQTIVMVTHDLDEAITLSDRVVVLSGPPSRVILDERIDIAHPRDVYSLRESEAFAQAYGRIWHVLGQEFASVEATG
ncbi:MAG: ABC transporter ATP-binding protein [Sneathiellaceae bacterium]